ncbi:GntR family transcriptional regulator [Saxibacter everestensis]|uniref:GntR family transcriptional regulator n=1 Tax=Saxibacter everestensis TaxID=2909229 RepID=A0ABY8QT32_9MICO|nr:GntR family transcriptional regulator [Brevibacteriaceae bacterium ZFBP1038]
MNQIHDTASARFGGWTTSTTLPPGVRDPSVTAADHAYRYLKDLIVTLELPPRAIITESEVATATGVSRTPVREAFFRLHSEKLLDILPRRGAVVPEITLRNIREQAETRLVMEGHGVERICAERIMVTDELLRLVEEQRTVLNEDPNRIVDMIRIDKEFHWTIVKATGNTEFAQLYNTLHDRQVRIGIAMFGAVRRRPCDAIDEHAHIAEALAEFNVDEALERLKYHLIGSLTQISGIFTN